MGLKYLGLQMIPWCFHVVGATRRFFDVDDDDSSDADDPKPSSSPSPAIVRLLGSDGRVRVFDRPVGAAELMAAHPRHLVCRSDAFVLGRRVPPLAAGDCLEPGHSYFLLPKHFFTSVLSIVTLATSLATGAGNQKTPPLLWPFEIHNTPNGLIQIRVSDEFLERLMMEEEEGERKEMAGKGSRVCTTEALEKDYRQLVRSRSWKPKLETIGESENRRRRIEGPFGGIRRRKKKTRKAHSKENKTGS